MVILNHLEQIHCTVTFEQFKFNLCCFYFRNRKYFTIEAQKETMDIWNIKMKKNSPFIAIGDSNLYFHINSEKKVINLTKDG